MALPFFFPRIEANLPDPAVILRPLRIADMIWIWKVFDSVIGVEEEQIAA